ncbi:MAG: hypothetical protein AAF086_02295 [Planctomycetota bacterium]
MTQSRASSTPAASSLPAQPATPAASRSMIVGVHAVLLLLTVLVVWATTGRDAGAVADAAVASHTTTSQEMPSFALHETPAIDRPHTAATPLPAARPTVSFARPAAEPVSSPATSSVSAPAPAEAFAPMVAIPQPGAAFPAELPTPARDDPHYASGGLYGTPGATRVVYLIDASGSLIDTFPFILNELQRTLSELKAEQSFAVLFFSGDRVIEAPPYGMKRATTQAVRHTSQWIDPGSGRIIASGPADARAGIRRALAYQPDAIILLSDGLTGGGERAMGQRARLLSLIGTANTQGAVFHTLQVRRPDPLSTPTRLGTLELIALQSGGVHRYLGEDDLLPDSP